MRKTFYAVLLFLIIPLLTETTQAQTPVQTATYQAGQMKYFSKTSNWDTTMVYYTDWFDMTHMDGQTIYAMYDLVIPSGTADTFKVTLQAAFPGMENTATTFFTVDTMYCVGQTASTPVVRATSTFFSFFPLVRARFEQTGQASRIASAFRFALYSKIEDYVPTAQNYSNVRP